MVNFDDMRLPYTQFSDGELRRLKVLYHMLSRPGVRRSMMFFYKLARALNFPVNWAVKPVVYNHFIGGASIEECARNVERLRSYNIDTMLSYSVEMQKDEGAISELYNSIMDSIAYAAERHTVPFIVFRPTSIIKKSILEKKGLDMPLSAAEQKLYDESLARINAICRRGSELGVKIIIDAERYVIQDETDRTVRHMMELYNRSQAIVFNTFQMYRSDRLEYLRESVNHAKDNGYVLGVKLVRGAYMDYERRTAREKRYDDPIYRDKDATDEAFAAALRICVENSGHVSLIMGSHNVESHKQLIELMYEYGIAPSNPKIYFSHLYGMGDNLSYNLAKAGYNVVKYMPYGGMKKVTPYLMRRVDESYVIKDWFADEAANIGKEIERRKTLFM